ncbi:MAG TPA: hypothetical protein VFO24_14110 [Usitatibacter sp.]|nr:hypothetical protein [Usitatibacter sp.]
MGIPTPQFLLMTVEMPGAEPSIDRAARELGVAVEDLDVAFGVVPIDPACSKYAVQVRADKVPAETRPAGEHRGPWSNAKIEPFGPLRGPKK